MFYLAREVGKIGNVLAEKKGTLSWLMNSNMVKPEKFAHLHLVYHFTVPLIWLRGKRVKEVGKNQNRWSMFK